MRVAALALGLLLVGVDLAPTKGTVVDRERTGGVAVWRSASACSFWQCRPELVSRRLPSYAVFYRWELLGGLVAGVSRCLVRPAAYWAAQVGHPFRCNSQQEAPSRE